MGWLMTEVERTFGALIVEMADGLCKLLNPKLLSTPEVYADGIANAAEAFREAGEKQDDEDRNGGRRVMGEGDCAEAPDLPTAEHALPEAEAEALRKIITAGMDTWGGMSMGVKTEWVVDTIASLLDDIEVHDMTTLDARAACTRQARLDAIVDERKKD